MNWGYKIIVVIVVFIIAMLAMVGVAYKQNNEMIESNYYEKEMNYQSLIDASNNLKEVSADTLLTLVDNILTLRIPATLVGGFESGQIEFLKNEDEHKDLTLPIKPDASGAFVISQSNGLSGKYTARMRWISAKKSYYKEQIILMP